MSQKQEPPCSTSQLVVTWYVPPERPDLHLRIAPTGAVRAIWLERWRKGSGYVPCGGDVLEERRFGEVTIPSRVSVGWWYGTPRYKPFFECEILAAEPL